VIRALIILLIAGAMSVNALADDGRRDGNWWREMEAPAKLTYMTGFFDGMDLGNNFSYWGIPDYKTNRTGQPTIDSYKTMSAKFLTRVTSDQIADGLDNFYEDFRNRSILTHNAVWIVLNMISGKPEDEMQKMVENFRKNAK